LRRALIVLLFVIIVLASLSGTENEWIVKLLNAFNSGNVHLFETMKPQ